MFCATLGFAHRNRCVPTRERFNPASGFALANLDNAMREELAAYEPIAFRQTSVVPPAFPKRRQRLNRNSAALVSNPIDRLLLHIGVEELSPDASSAGLQFSVAIGTGCLRGSLSTTRSPASDLGVCLIAYA
jgi:hypothetical protein